MGGAEVWGEEEGGWRRPFGKIFRFHHLRNIPKTADHSPSLSPSPLAVPVLGRDKVSPPVPPQKQPPSTHTGDLLRRLQVPFLPTKQRKKGEKHITMVRRALATSGLSRGHDGRGRGTHPGVPMPWLGWGEPPP